MALTAAMGGGSSSSLGRGFVRSGSGFVSTPATRAAARAAGTFGAEGYAGAEQTATTILQTFAEREVAVQKQIAATAPRTIARRAALRSEYGLEQERIAAAAAKPCPKSNEYKPIYPDVTCPIGYWQDIRDDGLWCVCDMWKFRIPTTPKIPMEKQTELPPKRLPTPTCLEKCNLLIGIPILYNACVSACLLTKPPTPPLPPTLPPTPPPTEQCPDGLMYDKPLISGCKEGYVPYDPGIGQKELCICVVRYEEAIKILKPSENGNGDGELGDLGKYTPYLLLAAGIGLIISMVKR